MKISERLRKAAEASDYELDIFFYLRVTTVYFRVTEAAVFYDSLFIESDYDFDSADERRLSLLFAAEVAEGEGL